MIIQTDDVLLWAESEDEMLEVLELFLRVAVCHNVAIHPGRAKCEIFVKETIYCGLKITRDGITVDPVRVNGLKNVQHPQNVGDVWSGFW